MSAAIEASKWSETTVADDATAIATRAAASGKAHYLTSVSASYSVTNSGLLELKDGTTVLGSYHVYDSRDIPFPKPLRVTTGASVSVELAASGTPGQDGSVVITGFTLPDPI